MHKFPVWSLSRELYQASLAQRNFSCLAPFCHFSPYSDYTENHSYFSRLNVTFTYCNSFTCMIIVLVCLFAQWHIYSSFSTIRKSINFNSEWSAKATTCTIPLLITFCEENEEKNNSVTRTNWQFKAFFESEATERWYQQTTSNRQRHECNLYLWHA